MKKELARVEKTSIEIEDHGLLTGWIMLEKEEGMHQGFGGLCLDTYDEDLKRRVGHRGGTDWILNIMRVFNVQKLEDCVGKMVYALYEDRSTIIGLEALRIDGGEKFLIKDWQQQNFTPEELSDD